MWQSFHLDSEYFRDDKLLLGYIIYDKSHNVQ